MQHPVSGHLSALRMDPLPDSLEEDLDAMGCATELLVLHASTESDRLAQTSDGGQLLSLWAWRLAVSGVDTVVRRLGLSDSALFRGVALLDAWLAVRASGMPDSSFIRDLPAACTAAVHVLCKFGALEEKNAGELMWRDATAAIGEELPRLCDDWFDVQPHDVQTQEFGLLHSLRWQINVPTVESWLSMIEARFGVVTVGFFSKPMVLAGQELRQLALTLLQWRPADKRHPPRRLASGLFGVGLLRAKLLPAEALRPQHVCQDEWEELFLQSQMVDEVPACTLSPTYFQWVLESLAIATHTPLEEVRQDCEITMGCLRGARGDLRRTFT
mmetsp:Transcript_90108/g.227274  ORF Transcript_90108/g.227274 Transcript_90108/m.227274 type:complete len:329 (-) Transcript_90108:265-1251(-)